jgi:hypothetical protein
MMRTRSSSTVPSSGSSPDAPALGTGGGVSLIRGGSLRVETGGLDGDDGSGRDEGVPAAGEAEGRDPDLAPTSAATCGDTDFTGGFSDGLPPPPCCTGSSPICTLQDSSDPGATEPA